MVAGITLKSIKTSEELLSMLESGNKNRTQHPTDANAESSRSHAVFQVRFHLHFWKKLHEVWLKTVPA